MKRILWIFLVLFLVQYSESRSLAKIKKRSIVIGVVQKNAPLGVDHRGKGVEFDLIVAMSQELGVPFNLVPVESIREGENLLKDDKIDAFIAGYRSNARNADQFLQSTPYYKSGLAILVPSSDNATYVVKDLESKIVATTSGSEARDFFKNYLPTCQVDVVTQIPEAVAMLKSHEVSAIVDDKVFLDYVASTDKSVRVLDALLSESSYIVLMNKASTELREEINKILIKLRTTTGNATPSPLKSILTKYGIDMPLDEIIGPNVEQASAQVRTNSPAIQPAPTSSPRLRLERLESQLVEMQKEIQELKKMLKK